MTHHIHQEIRFETTTDRVYEVLTNNERFKEMCGGAPTEIDAVAGGAFSCFGGMILGRNIECAPGERLVQAWRAKTWPVGVYSIVRFELSQDGAGTKLSLDHTGFPEGQGEHLAQGWKANYWEPMGRFLA